MTLYMMDMDGTLIEGFMDKQPREGHEWCDGEIYAQVDLLPNVYEKLEWLALHDRNSRFAIVTNQGGVAFGYQTEEEVYTKIGVVLAKLNFFWNRPFSVHVCFTHPQAKLDLYRHDDDRRKPGPDMLHEAIKAHDIDIHDHCCIPVMYTGDMEADVEAAAAAGVHYCDHSLFFGQPVV